MRFMGPETAYRYDRFKEEIFGKKQDEYKEKYRSKNIQNQAKLSEGIRPINHPFFKKIIFASVVGVSLYYANKKFKLFHQLEEYFDGLSFNPIHKAVLYSLLSDIKRRFGRNFAQQTLNQTKNIYFANEYFYSELKLIYKSLETKYVPHVISEQVFNRVNFGPLSFGNRCQKLYINQHGHVVRESKKSKISIGGLHIFGEKREQTLQFESTVSLLTEEEDIVTNCYIVNMANKLVASNEEYEKVYEECIANSSRIYDKINKRIRKEKQKAERNKKLSIFIFNS